MDEVISLIIKFLNFFIPEKIKLTLEYDSKNYSIEFKNETNRSLTIKEININGKNLLTNFSVIESHRTFPFQINSGQRLMYRLIISKLDEHPMNCEFYVKRYISGVKKIYFTL